ncbi:MAG TPA: DUF2807 domain-containing protein [Sphingomicrobium sp.]|jgi:hypothetical protein
MRSFLLPAAALIALATPAGAATRNFGITGFTKIRVDGPFKVRLATGVAPFAKASGSASALDRLAISVQGETLVVRSNTAAAGSYSGNDNGLVEISAGTHELSAAWLNGSGSLAIDRVKALKFDLSVQGSGAAEIGQAAVDQLNINALGTASARVGGKAGKLTAVVRGISSLDAAALIVKDATLGAEGAATIAANVSGSVKLDASGPATVRLAGRPACTLRVSGAATVSGCR